MKTRLSRDTMDVAASYSIPNGGQFNVNHEDCPAGTDERRRLYIKVTDDGKMRLAHCFNCGGSGALRQRPRVSGVSMVVPTKISGKTTDLDRYNNMLYTYHNLSIIPDFTSEEQSTSWPMGYFQDCLEEFFDADYFGLKNTKTFWIIPRGNPPDDIFGFITRTKEGKRYTNIIHPDFKEDSRLLIYNKDNSKTAILCEDAISAMKCCLAGFAGVALCGTHLSSDDAFKLSIIFDRFYVWLDNDKPEVLKAAVSIRDRISIFSDANRVNIISSLFDPKKYTLSQMRSYCER